MASLSPSLVEHSEEDHDHNHQVNKIITPQSSSTSSSLSSSFFTNTSDQHHEIGGSYYYKRKFQQFQPKEDVDTIDCYGRLSEDISLENEMQTGLRFSIWKKEEKRESSNENNLVKWIPTKIRLMRKMTNRAPTEVEMLVNNTNRFEDQKESSQNSITTIRVCSDCNTTKTPLWRSGPRGPKSLCNACGIRQRKARRAMAEAEAAVKGSIIIEADKPSIKTKNVKQKDKMIGSDKQKIKSRSSSCNLIANPRGRPKKKICFEETNIISLLSSSNHQNSVFPQDEKEAAILLMALSYGLVHG